LLDAKENMHWLEYSVCRQCFLNAGNNFALRILFRGERKVIHECRRITEIQNKSLSNQMQRRKIKTLERK